MMEQMAFLIQSLQGAVEKGIISHEKAQKAIEEMLWSAGLLDRKTAK